MSAMVVDEDDDAAFQADLARAIAASLEPDGAGVGVSAGRCSPSVLPAEDEDDESFQRQLAAAMAASVQCAQEDHRRRRHGHCDGDGSFGGSGNGGNDGGYAVQAHLQLQPRAHPPLQHHHPLQQQQEDDDVQNSLIPRYLPTHHLPDCSELPEPQQQLLPRAAPLPREGGGGAVWSPAGLLLKPLAPSQAAVTGFMPSALPPTLDVNHHSQPAGTAYVHQHEGLGCGTSSRGSGGGMDVGPCGPSLLSPFAVAPASSAPAATTHAVPYLDPELWCPSRAVGNAAATPVGRNAYPVPTADGPGMSPLSKLAAVAASAAQTHAAAGGCCGQVTAAWPQGPCAPADAAAGLLASSPAKHARPPSLAGVSDSAQPLMKRSRAASDGGGEEAYQTSSFNFNRGMESSHGLTSGRAQVAAASTATAEGYDGNGE
ncbi:hypothetical protein Agub_g9369, partial [Astrephomene gubernaculifera]